MIGFKLKGGDDPMKLLTNESDSIEMLALVVLSAYLMTLGLIFLFS